MLLVVFRVSGEPYAIDAAHVVAVVPRVELRVLPHSPEALVGLFRYYGQVVPVVDLGILIGDRPCAPRLSTRIILANDPGSGREEARIGLIAEDISDVRRVPDERVIPSATLMGQNPYLGSIVTTDNEGDEGLLPLISIEQILTGSLRLALTEAAP